MTSPIYQEAISAFTLSDNNISNGNAIVSTVAGGLINNSFKVCLPGRNAFLLQQINQNVFKKPIEVQQNYIHIWNYTQSHNTGLVLPTPLFLEDGSSLFLDKGNRYWRAFDFIENAQTFLIADVPAQAFTTAETFGTFNAAFEAFDTQLLKTVIPDFHNLSFRFNQFEDSLVNPGAERKEKAGWMIDAITERSHYRDFFDTLLQSPSAFLKRVMHHDAKIANVLFRKETGTVICPVDFDTVMPGYYFSDLGDMVRSMACSHDETSCDFDDIEIRGEYYEAIVSGYLKVMDRHLTTEELNYIHHAGIIMIYMQAIRFLADYLNNDSYYRISYPEQNFDRAKNQVILLKQLENFLVKRYNYELAPVLAEK